MYLEATGQVGVDGINLAQNRTWWQVLVYIRWTFIVHTTQGISWLTGLLPASAEVLCPKWCKQSRGARHRLKTWRGFANLKAHISDFINLTPKIIKITIHQKLWNWDLIYISTVVCCDMTWPFINVLKFIESNEHLFCWKMFHHSKLWNRKNSQLHRLSVHCQTQLWIQFTYVLRSVLVS